MICGGVFGGAEMPTQVSRTSPGLISDKVGTLGSWGERVAPVTASALSAPALTWLTVELKPGTDSVTCPAMRSFMAGPEPR